MRHEDDEQPGEDTRADNDAGDGPHGPDGQTGAPWTIEREQAWVEQLALDGALPAQLLVLERAQAEPDGAPAEARTLEICRQLTETGHAGACRVMARAHLSGRCADADTATGWVWMKKAADLGDLEAMTQWAIEHMFTEVPEGETRPVTYLYRAAINRHPEAMMTWARMLLWQNALTPARRAEAYAWLAMGASVDHAQSLYDLWCMTEQADDVPSDAVWRNMWLRRAAELGLRAAQREWSRVLWQQAQSTAEYTEAEGWLHKAASGGDLEAAFVLAGILGTRQGAADVSRGWMLTAARAGHQGAQREVGRFLADGADGLCRPTEAAVWLSRAAVPSPDRDEAIGNSALEQLQQLQGTMNDAQCAEVLALLSPDIEADARAVFAGVCDLAAQMQRAGGTV